MIIYKLTNNINGKVYIGQTARSLGGKGISFNVFTQENELVGTWITIYSCSRDLGIYPATITRCLDSKSNPYSKGYRFEYSKGNK